MRDARRSACVEVRKERVDAEGPASAEVEGPASEDISGRVSLIFVGW